MGGDSDKGSNPDPLPSALGVAGELIKAAAHNPSVRAAGAELGRAALTVAKTINIALLPLAAINFGYEKARVYFETLFQADLEEKLAGVPHDEVIEPKPSLAGPILQGLAFSHDERILKEMYLRLLASAMNKTQAENAHPAFAEVIKQLAAQEADLLCRTLTGLNPKPIVQVRLQTPGLGVGAGWHVLLNHFMDTRAPDTGIPVEVPGLAGMVDNWIRLGLVDVAYTEFCAATKYNWVNERTEFQRLKATYEHPAKSAPTATRIVRVVSAQQGRIRPTAFGEAFAKAVGMEKILRAARQA